MPRGATSCPTSPPAGRRPPRGWRPHDGPRGPTGPPVWPRRHAPRSRAAAARSSSCRTTVTSPGSTLPTPLLGPGRHVRLTADQGPQARLPPGSRCCGGTCRSWSAPALRRLRHAGPRAGVVVGRRRRPARRAAGALPPRAGGPRGPGASRGAALLAGGFARTAAIEAWVDSGDMKPIAAPRHGARCGPRVLVAGEGAGSSATPRRRAPHRLAHREEALARGPVLVQVPRRGYLPSLSCQTCRAPARCSQCHGPRSLRPRRCSVVPLVRCDHGGLRVRAVRRPTAALGSRRGPADGRGARAGLPGRARSHLGLRGGAGPRREHLQPRHRDSGRRARGRRRVCRRAPPRRLGLARPARPHRWRVGPALAGRRRAGSGGCRARRCRSLRRAGPTIPAVETLVRWDPAWFAERELAERRELRLPPTVRMAALTAPRRALQEALSTLQLPEVRTLGPLPAGEAPRGSCCGHLSTTGRPSRRR